MTPSPQEISQLLVEWSNGDQAAHDKLMPLVYDELRRIAKRYMRRQHPSHTLQTTALIHEAYLRLVNQREAHWQNRTHFFAVAARVMRQILVDHARSRHSAKRGAETRAIVPEEAAVIAPERAAEMIALDEALQTLTAIDRRQGRIVELRYFGGLTVEETAEILKISPITVKRDWSLAKAWLHQELKLK